MANNEILLKSASGQLIGAYSANFYDVNGNKLTYTPALGDDGWTTWTLSGDLYRLGEYCIYNTDAERVILPDSLTVIDGYAMRNNKSLTTLTIPDSVTTINSWAVMGCSELTTLFIGSGIQTIGANGFRDLEKLNSITITATTPPATSNYSFCEVAYNGTLYAPNDNYQAWVNDRYLLDGWTLESEGGDVPDEPTPDEPMEYFIQYTTTDGKKATITTTTNFGGAKVVSNGYYDSYGKIGFDKAPTQLGTMTFSECENLKTLILPDSIQRVEMGAVKDCPNLTDVHFGSDFRELAAYNYINGTGYDNGDYAFVRVPNLTNITMTNGGNDYVYVEGNCLYSTDNELILGGKNVVSVTKRCSISFYAFADRAVGEMIIGDVTVDTFAFAGSTITKLTSIRTDDYDTPCYPYSFYKCQNLEAIDISKQTGGLQDSNYNAFKYVRPNGVVYHNGNLQDYIMSVEPYNLGFYNWTAVDVGTDMQFMGVPEYINRWDTYEFSILCKEGDELTYECDEALIFNLLSDSVGNDGVRVVTCTVQVNPDIEITYDYLPCNFSVSDGSSTLATSITVVTTWYNCPNYLQRGVYNRFCMIYTNTPVFDGTTFDVDILETAPYYELDGNYIGRTVAVGTIYVPTNYSNSQGVIKAVSSGDKGWNKTVYVMDKGMDYDFPTRVVVGEEYDYRITTYRGCTYELQTLEAGTANITSRTDNGNGSETVTGKYTLRTNKTGQYEVTGNLYESDDTHFTIQTIPFVVSLTPSNLLVQIPSELPEETDMPINITYPAGGELNFNTPDDVVITIDEYRDNGDGTITAIGTIRANEDVSESIVKITVTDGTDTVTKTITILDKEPPMAAPTISINKYADLLFPQEGGTKYITITYENTLLAYINQPVSAAAIQIKAESTTETDTGVQIYYSITVPSTTMRREIPLTFSCLSPSGSSCTETYYATQEGQTETDDYCWINAYPVHLTFEATGGTQRIQVRAGYPDVDIPITAKVRNSKLPSINISWCTANFVSREYSDDYTEVTEQWDIVMNDHSHITEPFMADITFSYTNSYGNSASYGCTATVKGGDGEEQASKIEAYRTIMRFDANGVFNYSDATCTVAYHWIDEVDIEDPVISADWIVVTEGTHKSTAGKIEIPWHIAVGKNTSPNERTGTVTFSAIGMNDEELSISMTVIQGGADVKDETLEYVDLLWKDCEVELGDDDMTFEILDEYYDVFYTGRCQKRPLGEKNTFLINKIVQDYVWMEEIPALLNGTAEYQEHVNGYRKFRLDTPDTVGAMRSFYFKYDWSYQEGSPFVLSESIIPYVVEGQKNMITYCNLDYNKPQTDIYTWIKSNGSVENGAISAENEEYATKVITMPENADYYVMGGQRYEVLSPCRAKYVLYYLSPKGGWCWFPIMGKVKSSDRLTAYTLSSNYNNTTTQFGKKRYTVDIATDYDLSTGWLTESQSLRMWEMLESNMVYLHDMEKDVIFPVLMRQDTVEKKNVNRGERKMISYTFGVETSQGKMRI